MQIKDSPIVISPDIRRAMDEAVKGGETEFMQARIVNSLETLLKGKFLMVEQIFGTFLPEDLIFRIFRINSDADSNSVSDTWVSAENCFVNRFIFTQTAGPSFFAPFPGY